MAMDLNAIRARLKGLEEGKPKSTRWKPTDEHIVRLLPIPGDEDLAHIVKLHYGVDGGKPMACPSTWGEQCDFCDFAQTFRGWKDERGNDKTEEQRARDWQCYKDLAAAVKHYAPAVVRKKDSAEVEGPFLWEFTPKTYQMLLKVCANDDWNDGHPENGGLKVLTSLEHGLDVVVTLKKKGEKGNTTSYDATEVEERKKTSPVYKDKDGGLAKAKELLARVPDITSIAKQVTSAEASKVFTTWRAGLENKPLGVTDTGVERGGSTPTNSGETAALTGGTHDETLAKLEALLAENK